MISVAIADDNPLLRTHLQSRLQDDFRVVFAASSGREMVQWVEQNHTALKMPALVLMDIEMDDMDGIEATQKVKACCPDVKVIMLTVFDQEDKVWRSIMAGADGYILKDEPKDVLIKGINDILQGGAYMTPQIARMALQLMRQPPSTVVGEQVANELTRREREILDLLQTGMSYKQIAERLFISVHTAKTHIRHIYEKLQVRNKTEAANTIKTVRRP